MPQPLCAPVRPAASRGFTLIELLTVIAIIGILAAIIIPTVGAVRSTARGARCTSNLRNIHQALTLYSQENKGRWPAPFAPSPPKFTGNVSWWAALQDYFTGQGTTPTAGDSDAGRNWWYCPSAEESFPQTPRRVYSMNAYGATEGTPIVPSKTPDWSQTLAVADGSHNADGDCLTRFRNIADANSSATKLLDPRHRGKVQGLFMDGHIASFPINDPQLDTWITNLKR